MVEGKSYAIRYRVGVTAEDTIGTSIVRPIETRAGTHRTVTVIDEGDMPAGPRLVGGEMVSGDLCISGKRPHRL